MLFANNNDTTGYTKLFYPNGSLQSEGIIKNGKPDGYWKSYYPTGVIRSEGNRVNHLLDGNWIFYNSLGDTINKVHYILGNKNGYSYEYFVDRNKPESLGKVKLRELIVQNKKEGEAIEFYENGKIKERIHYKNNKKEGYSIEYDKEGIIITLKVYRKGNLVDREKINRYDNNGLKTGVWKEYYESFRVKKESNYKNDLLDGYYKEYYQNGSLRITLLYREGKLVQENLQDEELVEYDTIYNEKGNVKEIRIVKNGRPWGINKKYNDSGRLELYSIYDEKGKLIEEGGVDEDGNREGIWQEYFENGAVKAKGKYIKNLKEGKWEFYYKNGTIEQVGKYERNRYSGLWQWYYENGNLWKEEEYYNGREEGIYIEYDEYSEIIVQGEYFDGEREGEWEINVGDITEKGNYVTGLRDGKWKAYYDNGTLYFEGEYIQGNAEGKHKFFYPDGTLKEERYFVSGLKEKHWKKYDETGNLMITISYKSDREYRINGVKVNFPEEQVQIIE